MKDYSEYLNLPGNLEQEEKSWKANKDIHIRQAKVVNETCKEYGLKTVVEIGCATGNILEYLDKKLLYYGFDKNLDALNMAKNKFPRNMFRRADIRELSQKKLDLVFSFAILKHFALEEWDEIFFRISKLGRYFVFDMQIAEKTKDDGKEFHHVWFMMEEMKKRIDAAGLELLEIFEPEAIAPIFICRDK